MADDSSHPSDLAASLSRGQLHIIAVLQQHGQVLAEIHQMVSPPEKRDEPSLRDILSRMAEALDRQATALEALTEHVSRIETAAAREGTAG